VVCLADEVLFLIGEGQIVGPPILLRVILESVFNLAALVSIENFHARKTVWELRDWLRRLRNLGLESLMGERKTEVLALISRIEKQYGLAGNDPIWPVTRIAHKKPESQTFCGRNILFLAGTPIRPRWPFYRATVEYTRD
jgi:hypothetical protein